MQKEIWKKYENEDLCDKQKFEISNLGRVKSLNKAEPTILKGYVNNGYITFSTRKKNGKRTLTYVHKAVATHFLEKENEDQDRVLHLNYDKLDNKASNLKWVTVQESEAHANSENNPKGSKISKIRQYWDTVEKEDRFYANKLTAVQALKIKKLATDPNRKTRIKMIAKQFGVTPFTVYSIKRGSSWAWLSDESLREFKEKKVKESADIGKSFMKKLNDAKK